MIKEQRNKLYRKMGFYEKYVKRIIDIIGSGLIIVMFGWLYIIIAILVRIKLGSPVLFSQYRPGLVDPKTGEERIFKMQKFRTMTDKRDKEGNLLPDEIRLTKFGSWLRSTSLDELPEVFCILKGTMTFVGPRPQLVRDMVFMSKEQRIRHTAKPGLSGLAQVRGRNAISWEEKFEWDLKYIEKINLGTDVRILFETIEKAFLKKEGITSGKMATSEDFGDYLLRTGKISRKEYEAGQIKAKEMINKVIAEK